MKDEALKTREQPGARALLGRLENTLHSQLKSLSVGAQPLVDEVRAGVAALYPEPGGTRLAPKEQEARQAKVLESLDELEDVLEALQLAARSRGKE